MNAQNPDMTAATALVPEIDSTATTAMATETTMLNPRFYTTDFDEMDRVDVSSIRPEWDKLIAQMKSDPNKSHFKKNADWDQVDWAGMEPTLRREFIDLKQASVEIQLGIIVLRNAERCLK